MIDSIGSAGASRYHGEPPSTSSVTPCRTTPVGFGQRLTFGGLCKRSISWFKCVFTPRLHFTLSPKNGVVEEWGRARMTRGTKERSVGFSPCHYPRNPSGPWRPLRRVFGLCRASVCDSGLKGRFQSDCGCVVMHGVPGAYAPGCAETGPSGLWGAVAAWVWLVPCVCLRFRPEGPISGSPGRSPGSGAPPKNCV